MEGINVVSDSQHGKTKKIGTSLEKSEEKKKVYML